jgi:hypothetical protein
MDAELSRRISVMAKKYRQLQDCRYAYLAALKDPEKTPLAKQDLRDRVDMAIGATEFCMEQVMLRHGELLEKTTAEEKLPALPVVVGI